MELQELRQIPEKILMKPPGVGSVKYWEQMWLNKDDWLGVVAMPMIPD